MALCNCGVKEEEFGGIEREPGKVTRFVDPTEFILISSNFVPFRCSFDEMANVFVVQFGCFF